MKKRRDQVKKQKNLIDTDNSMVITRGEGEWGQVEEGKGSVDGDGRRLNFRW